MNRKILLLSLLAACFLQVQWCVAAEDLYTAEVPVADASPDARKAAIRQAFEQVLVKASGYRELKGKRAMQTVLKNAENHVQQFRYRTIPGDDDTEEQRRLWVAFEKGMVQKALSKLGLSVWEQGRPQVLVWLAREQNGKRSLVDPERNSALLEALRDAAARRGMPLLLPLMDLQDQSALRVSDIWSGDREHIEKASLRYASQVILAGRLRSKGDAWEGRWVLYLPDSEKTFSSRGADEGGTAAQGLDKVMDWLAARYVPAVDSESAELVKIRFLNIRSLQDYSMIMSLLESLDALSAIAVEESLGDQLLLRVKVRGGRDILRQRLSLEPDLTPVASVPDEETDEPERELSYRLR